MAQSNQSDWDALLRDLRARSAIPGSDAMADTLAQGVLAAPAAVAFWIRQRAPQLAAKPELRLAIIGAEMVDAADGGRWYQCVPAILGCSARVDVTLVGDSLETACKSAASRHAPEIPARLVRAPFREFVGVTSVGEFDIAFLFQPGLQKHRGWLEDGSLGTLIAAGVAVVASAYEEDEAQVDGWVAESYGYRQAGEPLVNPLFLDLSDGVSAIRWGRALWQFDSTLPVAGSVPDRSRLDALDLLTRMVMHSMATGTPAPFAPGAPVELRSSQGAVLRAIHIFDGRLVDPASRAVFRFAATGELVPSGELTTMDMTSWPGVDAREIERAMWGARIKATRLAEWHGVATWAEAGEDKARAMYRELRARAARRLGLETRD